MIYPDGSCLACPVPTVWLASDYETAWDPNVAPGFLPDGRLGVSIEVNYPPVPQLGTIDTDGIGFQPLNVKGSWRQPEWSPTGRLAAVRLIEGKAEVFVTDRRTGSPRQLTRNGATSPTWSPDGRRLAVVHNGWIELIGFRGSRLRWLARGRAPAWAPNGRELAFVGAHQRLFVIASRGGRPRPVGRIHAQSVDWQPVTGKPASWCQAPAGSSVAAVSPDATVTADPPPVSYYPGQLNGAFSVLGCLTSDGRQRLLESMPPSDADAALAVGAVALADNYAALVNESTDDHYGGSSDTVAVFDLRTGTTVADRGGESAGCQYGEVDSCYSGVDQLVLGPGGVTAAHTFVANANYPSPPYKTAEQIVAHDSTGTHTVDSITTTGVYNATPSALSDLALSGDTLTWRHAGTPESAQLN